MSSVSIFTEETFVEKTTSCVYFHVIQIERGIKKFPVVVVHGKEMYQKARYICKICRLTFKTFCVLTRLFSLPCRRRPPPSFIDVCKLLGIRMRFFV